MGNTVLDVETVVNDLDAVRLVADAVEPTGAMWSVMVAVVGGAVNVNDMYLVRVAWWVLLNNLVASGHFNMIKELEVICIMAEEKLRDDDQTGQTL